MSHSETRDRIVGNLGRMFDSMRARELQRHAKVIRTLPFELKERRTVVRVRAGYTDTAGEHFVVLEQSGLLWRYQILFSTTAWVCFLRLVGRPGTVLQPFVITNGSSEEVYWKYELLKSAWPDWVILQSSLVTDRMSWLQRAEYGSTIRMSLGMLDELRRQGRKSFLP